MKQNYFSPEDTPETYTRIDELQYYANLFIEQYSPTEIEISAVPELPIINNNILSFIIGLLEISVPEYTERTDYSKNIVLENEGIYIENQLLLKKIK